MLFNISVRYPCISIELHRHDLNGVHVIMHNLLILHLSMHDGVVEFNPEKAKFQGVPKCAGVLYNSLSLSSLPC